MKVKSVLAAATAIAALMGPHATCSAAVPSRSGSLASDVASVKTLSVIMFLRHGIRAPLSGELPDIGHPHFWPKWAVDPGHLTPRGYRNVQSLGNWLGQDWRRRGLLPTACPTVSDLVIRSNNVPRTIESAQALVAGLAPGCKLVVDYKPVGQVDPVFDPIGAGAVQIDTRELANGFPADGTEIWAPYGLPITELQRILGCARPAATCGMNRLPSRPITVDAKGIHLDQRSRGYAGAAQGLLLQYAEGLPMPQVQGRSLGASDVKLLSRLHAVPFIYEARASGMAAPLSKPFLNEVRKQTAVDSSEARVRLFVGHDNVLSAITARLGIDFTANGYALNDPPIGGGFGFELIETAKREKRVRGFYIAQSPEQLRRVSPLRGSDMPWKRYFSFRGCDAPAALGCPTSIFRAMLDDARDSEIKNSPT